MSVEWLISVSHFFFNFTFVDNNARGCFAEYQFGIECLKRGIVVSYPLLDACVYDCIADTGQDIFRIQIKSTAKDIQENRNTVQANWHTSYSTDDVDYFAVYVSIFEGFFIFKNNGQQQSIRVSLTNENSKFFNNFGFK